MSKRGEPEGYNTLDCVTAPLGEDVSLGQ